jgi:hypothetical protein
MITILGWLGAGLVIVAYAQTATARLRQVGILASIALIAFNLCIGVWSNVALELVLVFINLRRLVQIRSHDGRTAQYRQEIHLVAEPTALANAMPCRPTPAPPR